MVFGWAVEGLRTMLRGGQKAWGPGGYPHVLEPKKLFPTKLKTFLTQWESISETHMNSTYWGEHEVESLFQRWFCCNFVHTAIEDITKTPSDSFQESYTSLDGYFTFMDPNKFPHCLLYPNKQALLSLQPSFSLSSGCFAWILCCLLQICRKEIGWPYLTLRVNYKSNNSINSFVISKTILLLQAKKCLGRQPH